MIPECTHAADPRSGSICAELRQNCTVGGLLWEIQTTIRTEPFTDYYSIIRGKELGR